ncbi:hypothetical protein [Actinoplanes sp. NPDC049681]|uniref:hypothetical protein n=1 Tax=Actinoplanes sp. NPDC049681 TaxID=3363905 RepID=UPI00378B5666
MFDNLRNDALAGRGAAQDELDRTGALRDLEQAHADELAAVVPPLEAQLAATVAATAGPDAAVAEARATVAARTAERDASQAAWDASAAALRQHENNEPEVLGPNGKPSPEHMAWLRELRQLRNRLAAAGQRLQTAQAALDQANQVLTVRSQEAAAAAGAVAEAQRRLEAARADVARAEQVVEGLDRALDTLRQNVARADAGLAALDAREARLLAEPLDRTDLQSAADDELTAYLGLRRGRRVQLDRRLAARTARAAVLTASDATAEELAVVHDDIRSWPELGNVPGLAAAAGLLADIIARSRAQRATPPDSRDDDLAAVTAHLTAVVQILADTVAKADAQRDAARARLDALTAQLREHQAAGA